MSVGMHIISLHPMLLADLSVKFAVTSSWTGILSMTGSSAKVQQISSVNLTKMSSITWKLSRALLVFEKSFLNDWLILFI